MPNAAVIGFGKSGNAAARLLKTQGYAVSISDRASSDNLQQQSQALIQEGINVQLGDSFDPEGRDLELVVVSPGVPWDLPALEKARRLGVVTIGEMELAWRSLSSSPWIAITGTNGKTTTTALTAAMFATSGHHAPAFGNIGYAACEVALLPEAPEFCIAELSSYQIESAPSLTPNIGLWTTFTPDHLARHKTLSHYYDLKARLLSRSHLQIFNGDDVYLRQMAQEKRYPISEYACWTSIHGKEKLPGNPDLGAYIDESGWVIIQGERLFPAEALKMPGQHNLQNLLMAVAAAHFSGLGAVEIEKAMREFPGVPHRLELIRTWKDIEFINDSKATNYDAAEVGLSSMGGDTVLIAGGDPKEGNDEAWIVAIKAKAVKVLLIGDASEQFAKRLTAMGYSDYEEVGTMANAIPRAAEVALEKGAKHVLLSPACASFDQYSSFEHRGDDFRQICLESLN
jgi:UDP-N-acetylmuramoylalanine--D-glutamate ligase